MVPYSQSTQTTSALPEPVAPPTSNVVGSQVQPVVVVQSQVGGDGGCGCCSVPPDASQAVKATRWSSIAVIITHTVALAAFGFYIWAQWVASLFGIIMGSVLLCNFNKCCYITAAVLFSIGIIFDLLTAILWLYVVPGLAIFPFLGIVASLIGSIAACMAVGSWNDSGAANVMAVQSGPVQVPQGSIIPPTQPTNVQPHYTYPVASRGAPPPYGV